MCLCMLVVGAAHGLQVFITGHPSPAPSNDAGPIQKARLRMLRVWLLTPGGTHALAFDVAPQTRLQYLVQVLSPGSLLSLKAAQ